MSTKRMLIDAAHPEETRVVTVTDSRLDEFDVEAENRKQIKGNIYLAKVTRVEPSLQAAFVEYGGNRHGFLAFNEIHPDYYQIPVADREALIAETTAQHDRDDADRVSENTAGGGAAPENSESAEGETAEGGERVEEVGGDDDDMGGDIRRRRTGAEVKGRYKIQEVIKRNQILLIQVVKEERSAKGAALTSYISLAGRYCVLMPNTARGGGVSRKIGDAADRKRLKSIVADLPITDGMAVIVRTAGSNRTKPELKRDFDYLIRLWAQIRDKTLESIAPSLVHEEADLIKRAVRDLYTKDIEEVVVEGEEAYRSAKDFMKLLIPSHAKRVQQHKDTGKRLFQEYGVEGQLDAMYAAEAQLPAGGYIVINPTEALVSIDVNSGRATRERNIEETALATNLEAAHEVARQLRLRDLAGLIVIDFIDMNFSRNNARVERALKDAMKSDRARIQIGRISPFGLLELSRQRLRSSLLETSTEVCPRCGGVGNVRTPDSAALSLLRALEAECITHPGAKLRMHAPRAVAFYVLNQKRHALNELEKLYEVSLSVEIDKALIAPAYRLERTTEGGDTVTITDAHAQAAQAAGRNKGRSRGGRGGEDRSNDRSSERGDGRSSERSSERGDGRGDGRGEDGAGQRRRRRPRGRTGEAGAEVESAGGSDTKSETAAAEVKDENGGTGGEIRSEAGGEASGEDGARKRRRRGRRGGRNRRKDAQTPDADTEAVAGEGADAGASAGVDADTGVNADANAGEPKTEAAAKEAPKPRRRGRPRASTQPETEAGTGAETGAKTDESAAAPEAPASSSDSVSGADEPQAVEAEVNPEAAKTTVVDVDKAKPASSRRGWWRRGAAE